MLDTSQYIETKGGVIRLTYVLSECVFARKRERGKRVRNQGGEYETLVISF